MEAAWARYKESQAKSKLARKELQDKAREGLMSREAIEDQERSTLERSIRQKVAREEELKAAKARDDMTVDDSVAEAESEEVDEDVEKSQPMTDIAEDSGAGSTAESKTAEPGVVAASSAIDMREEQLRRERQLAKEEAELQHTWNS